MNIDYRKLGHAYTHYMRLGYKYLEVPWLVSPDAIVATLPQGRLPLVTKMGIMVGSGEQSFIQMMLNDKLTPGKYMCVTPCTRDEELSELHRLHFMKLELINTEFTSEDALTGMYKDALDFFEFYVDGVRAVKLVDDKAVHGYTIDIESPNSIELGSYGVRKYKHLQWVYGTGLAEPRLSTIIKDTI